MTGGNPNTMTLSHAKHYVQHEQCMAEITQIISQLEANHSVSNFIG